MAKKNTKVQEAQAQAQATQEKPKASAKRLTVADLATQMTALTDAVTALTKMVAAQAQAQAQAPATAPATATADTATAKGKGKKGAKKGAKAKAEPKAPKLPAPSREEWLEYKRDHWFQVSDSSVYPTKHDKNSALYKMFLNARKKAAKTA